MKKKIKEIFTFENIVNFVFGGQLAVGILLTFGLLATILNLYFFIYAFYTGGWEGLVQYWNVWTEKLF